MCKKIEEREVKGADIVDILSRYQKDGGGYDQLYYGQEDDAYGAGYYDEEDPYYQEAQ